MEITGLTKPRELFRLFDQDKDGVISFVELFPDQATRKAQAQWDTADQFWNYWSRQNRDFENGSFRGARWQPSNPDEEMRNILEASKFSERVAEKKKWMSATIRRLKSRGKSDARCREVVALHLPRGTGPKDREDVQTFSHAEVRACRKRYTDQWMEPVKNIQKVVVDMKEIKRDLRSIREELYAVTEGRLLQQRAEEERKSIASLLIGSQPDWPASGPQVRAASHGPPRVTGPGAGPGEGSHEALPAAFKELAGADGLLDRAGFAQLLVALCPAQSFSEPQLGACWCQATALASGSGGADSGSPREARCGLEQFALWFASPETWAA